MSTATIADAGVEGHDNDIAEERDAVKALLTVALSPVLLPAQRLDDITVVTVRRAVA